MSQKNAMFVRAHLGAHPVHFTAAGEAGRGSIPTGAPGFGRIAPAAFLVIMGIVAMTAAATGVHALAVDDSALQASGVGASIADSVAPEDLTPLQCHQLWVEYFDCLDKGSNCVVPPCNPH